MQPITDKNNRNKFSNKINSEYECQICNFKTPYKTIRDRHAGLHLDGMLYKCLLCGLRADTSEKLREHMLSVHTSSVKRYRCDMCTYKACSELSVIKHKSLVHQTVHHETTDLLLRQECLWRPVVSADGERTYPCKLCDFIGTRSTYLLNHMSVHRERKHPCSYCEYRARHILHLERHLQYHSNNIVCSVCGYQASRKQNLDGHKIKVHGSL